MLVSPRRILREEDIRKEDSLELATLINEYKKVDSVLDAGIKVTKKEDIYTVIDGIKEAKAAYLAGIPYISVLQAE
ncbi:MAG TPA: hypothetical protein DDY59_01550 [Lachnospiraceae bacterium]|nr:hypothetical protein [Lachnospiraceae bacterium]